MTPLALFIESVNGHGQLILSVVGWTVTLVLAFGKIKGDLRVVDTRLKGIGNRLERIEKWVDSQ